MPSSEWNFQEESDLRERISLYFLHHLLQHQLSCQEGPPKIMFWAGCLVTYSKIDVFESNHCVYILLRVLLLIVQSLSCVWLCDPMDCSTPGFPVIRQLLEFAYTHVQWVNNFIQPSHSLLPSSSPAFNLSQHQGLFQRVGSSHHVAKVLELQLQSFQGIFRVDFL